MRKVFIAICCFVYFAVSVYSQLESCYYIGVCGTDPLSTSCRLSLLYTDCQGFEHSKRINCINQISACIEDCSCQCVGPDPPTGFRGKVSWYDPCRESLIIRTYECDNCGTIRDRHQPLRRHHPQAVDGRPALKGQTVARAPSRLTIVDTQTSAAQAIWVMSIPTTVAAAANSSARPSSLILLATAST